MSRVGRFKSIQSKIALLSGGCLLAALSVIIVYASLTLRNNAGHGRDVSVEAAEKYAVALARAHGVEVQTVLEKALVGAVTFANTLSGIKNEEMKLELSREEVVGMLRGILSRSDDFLAMGSCWEPEQFDGLDAFYAGSEGHDATGRFIPYLSKGADGRVFAEPLVDYQTEDYYQLPKKTRKAVITEPYVYPVRGEETFMTTLVAPVLENGEFYGVVTVDIDLGFFQALVDDVKNLYGGTARMTLFSNKGVVVSSTGKPELAGKSVKEVAERWEAVLDRIGAGKLAVEVHEDEMVVFTPVTIGKTGTPWSMSIVIPVGEITREADLLMAQSIHDMWSMVGISVACLAAALAMLWFFAGTIVTPVRDTVLMIRDIAEGEGDLTKRLDIKSENELGELSHWFIF